MNNYRTGEHLGEEDVAQFVESLIDPDRLSDVHDEVTEHAETCLKCKREILEVYQLMKDDAVARQQISDARTTFRSKRKRTGRLKLSMYVSAAVLVLLAGIYWLTKESSYKKPAELYARYMEPYPDIISVKGNNGHLSSAGIMKYNNRDYGPAAVEFEKILEKEPNNDTFLLYSAISHLYVGEYKTAVEQLEIILLMPSSEFANTAKWYTGLALLKENEPSKPVALFRELAEGNSIYKERAHKILVVLK